MSRKDTLVAYLKNLAHVAKVESGVAITIEPDLLLDAIAALSSCAFCRGLGYIVNPDDLKREPCYCQKPPCACGGKEPLAVRDVPICDDDLDRFKIGCGLVTDPGMEGQPSYPTRRVIVLPGAKP